MRKQTSTFREFVVALDERWGDLGYYRQQLDSVIPLATGQSPDSPLHQEIESEFRHILHATIWTLMVSAAEKQLRILSEALREELKLPLSLRQLSGSWIESARIFFRTVAGVQGLSPEVWTAAEACVEIRNCWVHNLGELHGYGRRALIEQFIREEGSPDIDKETLLFSPHSTTLVAGTWGILFGELFNESVARVEDGA